MNTRTIIRTMILLSVVMLALTLINAADASGNEITFVLGTDENYESLMNVAGNVSVDIGIYDSTQAMSMDFVNKSVIFLASLDYETITWINSTVDLSANTIPYNLSNNLSIGNVDDVNITKYWIYGGDENINRLVTYLNVTFCNGNKSIEPPIPPENKLNVTIVSSSDYIISGMNKVAQHDPIINDTMNVKTYFAQSYPNITLPDDLDLSDQDVIFINHVSQPAVEHIEDTVQAAKRNGAFVITTQFEDILNLSNVNITNHPYINQYIDNPCQENYRRFLIYLGNRFDGFNGGIEQPILISDFAIYHPDVDIIFEDRDEYLDWYGNNTAEYQYNPEKPTIGIVFHKNHYVKHDLKVEDLLIRKIQEKDCNVIPVFCSHQYNFKDFFMKDGITIVDSVITCNYRMNWDNFTEGVQEAKLINVTWLQGINLYSVTPDEWNATVYGVPSSMYPYEIAQAEMDGIIEPIVISGKVEDMEGNKYYEPIDYQVQWRVDRAIAWAQLHHKSNSNFNKKIVIPFYSEGGGKANPGADIDYYLDVPASLENLLYSMKDRDYNLGTEPLPNKTEIAKLIQEASNVGTWAPGVLDKRVKSGNVILIHESKYFEWFSKLPKDKQDEVIEHFGAPPGEIMVYKNETGKYIVIPKIQLGNILIMPHPTWGFLQNDTTLYYDGAIPPHHEYIAFYFWLNQEYEADAMFSIFTQISLMPGKIIGLSRYDWGGLLLQDMPHIHTLKVDMDSGLRNKRRANAVIVDYITPPIVASGLYENLTMLQQKISLYNEAKNEQLKERYKEEIIECSQNLNIGHDLDLNLTLIANNTTMFEGFLLQLSGYLEELKGEYMPYGSHILSEPPTGDKLVAMVKSMLGDDFVTHVSAINSSQNTTTLLLTECLLNNLTPSEAQNKTLGLITDDISEDLYLAIDYASSIDACRIEIPRTLDAFEGKYIPPGPGDSDPVRNPDVLPTGRNTYSFDERLIPTEAAWEIGVNITDQLLSQHLEKNGEYPRKIAFVLWSSETSRHQGVMESEILYLLGIRPKWDKRDRFDDKKLELIPSDELGRPRIDVVIVTSGTYRQMWQKKILLIDRAVRLAAQDNGTAYPNFIKENSELIKIRLIEDGYNESQVEMLSMARIFSEAIGTTTPNLQFAIPASNTWENDTKLGDLYISRESYIYGEHTWGEYHLPELFEDNLRDVEIGVFSRSTNNYGILDHPMVASYFGGLSLAIRSLTGETPDMYINNLREIDDPVLETLSHFFNRELRTRYFNPEWIKGMMEHEYDGTRYISQFTEDLWMWNVVTPEIVTDAMWKEVYDIYIGDKYELGLEKYFDSNNPYAYQSITAQMLEAARKHDAQGNPYWETTDEVIRNLVKEYVESVAESGAACCHHTCGNPLLDEYIQGLMSVPGIVSEEIADKYCKTMDELNDQKAPADTTVIEENNGNWRRYQDKKSGSGNETIEAHSGFGTNVDKAPEAAAGGEGEKESDYVEGYEMQDEIEPVSEDTGSFSFSGSDILGLVIVILIMGAIYIGYKRKS
ncbi:MAG: cobaltochelatase subunit CobN [Methanosarcinales archaeon]|nr:cobaltochelatase subunit CobN [Methanosarcinales archaeon]